jgi:hypothetical protein
MTHGNQKLLELYEKKISEHYDNAFDDVNKSIYILRPSRDSSDILIVLARESVCQISGDPTELIEFYLQVLIK